MFGLAFRPMHWHTSVALMTDNGRRLITVFKVRLFNIYTQRINIYEGHFIIALFIMSAFSSHHSRVLEVTDTLMNT